MVDVLPLSFRLDLEQYDMKRVFADWCHKHQPNLRCLPLVQDRDDRSTMPDAMMADLRAGASVASAYSAASRLPGS